MATITRRTTQDGAIRYRATIRLRGLPPVSQTFDRKGDASRWADATQAELRARRNLPDLIQATRRTLGELFDAYEAHRKAGDGFDRQRAGHVAYWRARFGDLTLAAVTPAMIEQALVDLAESRTSPTRLRRSLPPGTRNRYLATLRHAWNYGIRTLGVGECQSLLSRDEARRAQGPRSLPLQSGAARPARRLPRVAESAPLPARRARPGDRRPPRRTARAPGGSTLTSRRRLQRSKRRRMASGAGWC